MLVLLVLGDYCLATESRGAFVNEIAMQTTDETNSCNNPSYDGDEKVQKVDGEIVFYDMFGTEDKDVDTYMVSMMVFEPVHEGKTIEIEFVEMDLNGGAVLKLFSGFKYLDSYNDGWDDVYSMPSGAFATLASSSETLTYQSSHLSGKMSVGFSNGGGSGKGWKAIVREVDAKEFDGIIITKDHKIVDISEEKHFFDDGGPDENCTEGFEGQITFVPTTPGQSIMLDFKSFEIFNTYAMNNTIFRVYNGKEVSEDKLVGEYLKSPGIIKSSSEDGAITVYCKVKVSNTKAGWDIIVKQFMPSPMIITSVEAEQKVAREACAGDKGVEVYELNISAENTLSPLHIESLRFSTEGSTDAKNDIEAAYLYASQSWNDFSKAKIIGDKFINPNGEFSFNVNQELLEGNNYFWLVYDLKSSATDKNVFDAKCVSVKTAAKEYDVTNASPATKHTVSNIYKMKKGHSTIVVRGQFGFTDDNEGYSGKYSGDGGDQIVTFIPNDASAILELDFSMFDIAYSSSSYGQKSTFVVYSGTECKEENIIWELNDSSLANVGPDKLLRSTFDNKAITIKFNTNNASSYYCKQGWDAVVREYIPSDMSVKATSSIQSEIKTAKLASENLALIRLDINTEGMLNPLSLKGLAINTKLSAENISKVKVYSTGTEENFSTDILFGEFVPTSKDCIVSGELELKEGDNYLWLAVDIADDAIVGSIIDAQISKIVFDCKEIDVTDGNPDGECLIVNEFNLELGENPLTTVSEKLVFYDDGGKDDKYSNNFEGHVVFVPAIDGNSVKIDFELVKLSYNDVIKIYNGKEILDENLNTTVSGYKAPSEAILSTSEDGALTVVFTSTSRSNNDGWKAEVSQFVPVKNSIKEVNASHPYTGDIVRGSKDVQLLRVKLDVEGDKGLVDLNSLKFNISNKTKELISNARLYYTASSEAFSMKTLLGSAIDIVENSLVFSAKQVIDLKGSYYLWLVCDTKNSAEVGDVIDAELVSLSADDKDIAINVKDPDGNLSFKKGVKGEFVIGSSDAADFNTFQEAVLSLKEGVEADVTFFVESGTYNELVRIPHINGTSDDAKIVFKSKTGNPDDVIITCDKYSSPAYPDPNYGMFNIEGADYLSLENMTFKTEQTLYEAVIFLRNMSRHITIKGNKISTKMVSSTSFSSGTQISLIETKAENEENQNNDYICIEENILEGGYIGIAVGGTGYVRLPKEDGAIVKKNIFKNQGSKGIYINNENNALVCENTITNDSSTKSGFQAMDLYRMYKSSSVFNNLIIINSPKSAKGMDFRETQGEEEQSVLVYNNMISISAKGLGDNATGLLLGRNTKNISLAYNTVLITGPVSTSSRTFSVERKSLGNISLVNNILQNKAEGAVLYFSSANYLDGILYQNNNYFSSVNYTAKIGSEDIKSFVKWQEKVKDESSFVKKVEFYSNEDLHLKVDDDLNKATPLSYISLDIDGEKRHATSPFVGADEYRAPDLAAPVMLDDYPKLKNVNYDKAHVLVKFNESGLVYCIAKKKSEDAPTIEELRNDGIKVSFNADIEKDIEIKGLDSDSNYHLYMIAEDLFDNVMDKIVSVDFTTLSQPTLVSTFEKQEIGTTDFTDGTAIFNGFSVVKEDGPRYSYKIARCNANTEASVCLTNTKTGLTLNGFFLRSKSSIVITGVKADGSRTSGLTVKKTDDWKYVCLLNLDDVVSLDFSTCDEAYEIDDFSGEPLALEYIGDEEYTVQEGVKLDLSDKIKGGAEPYDVIWTNVKTDDVFTSESVFVSFEESTILSLFVTDVFGKEFNTKVRVNVLGDSKIGSFEDLNLEQESYWWGDASVDGEEDFFYTGSYKLNNWLFEDYSTWGGFAYSNITSTDFDSAQFLKQQFCSAAGGGARGTDNYGVAYVFGTHDVMEISSKQEGEVLSGMYVTNTAWLVSAVENGDGISGKPFETGDWFKIVAVGYDSKGNEVASTDFYLADYRSENTSEHVIYKDWTWWDLSVLGKVKSIYFKAEGSRNNSRGLTLPGYFCLDEINNKEKEIPIVFNPIKDFEMPVLSSHSILFSDIFPESVIEEDQTVELVSNSNEDILDVDVDIDQVVFTSDSNEGGKVDLSLKVSCPKHQEIFNFTVDVIAKKLETTLIAYPNPVRRGEEMTIKWKFDNWRAQVFDSSGHLVSEFISVNNTRTVNFDNLSAGIYILKIFNGREVSSKRFIVK